MFNYIKNKDDIFQDINFVLGKALAPYEQLLVYCQKKVISITKAFKEINVKCKFKFNTSLSK